jgi:hypothetical protein
MRQQVSNQHKRLLRGKYDLIPNTYTQASPELRSFLRQLLRL